MTSGDFDPFQVGVSEELSRHAFEELVLAEDWGLRFSANSAAYRALGAELAAEQDPARVMNLAEQRRSSFVASLGSAAISLWQRHVLAGRQQFAAEFGG